MHAIILIALALLLAGFNSPACAQSAGAQGSGAQPCQALTQINAYRRQHGLGPLTLDPALMRAAQRHAADMAAHDRMSHTVSQGDLRRRIKASGARARMAAENVSAGYGSAVRALGGWQKSPAHNRNLLLPSANRMGIAAAYRPDTRYKHYWTLIVAGD